MSENIHNLDNMEFLEETLRKEGYGLLLDRGSLQRLRKVRLLGTMQYIVPLKQSYNRYEHTLAVAYLAALVGDSLKLSDWGKKVLVVASLIHDIGHTPLSHASEVFLRRYQGLYHEAHGLRVAGRLAQDMNALGERQMSKCIRNAIRILRAGSSNQVTGENLLIYTLMKSALSLDAIDGVTRTARSIGIPYPDPLKIVSGFFRRDEKIILESSTTELAIELLNLEQKIYEEYIYSARGMAAQAMLTRALEKVFSTKRDIRSFLTLTDEQVYDHFLENLYPRVLLQAMESDNLYVSLNKDFHEVYQYIVNKLDQYGTLDRQTYGSYPILERDLTSIFETQYPHEVIIHPTIRKHFEYSKQTFLHSSSLPIDTLLQWYETSRTYGQVIDIFIPPHADVDPDRILSQLQSKNPQLWQQESSKGEVKETLESKSRGAYSTPTQLVQFMVRWAVRDTHLKILDPASGDGEFLYTAYQRLISLGTPPSQAVNLVFGVEMDPRSYSKGLKRWENDLHPPERNLINGDFFDILPQRNSIVIGPEVDVVVGNPPYIRFHEFRGSDRKKALEAANSAGVHLCQRVSSWAPYLIHAISFLKNDGRLAMVLPREFLTADYARPVRSFLIKRFRSIILVSFNFRIFPTVQQNVVVLLASQDGPPGIKKVMIETYESLYEDFTNLEKVEPPEFVSEWLGSKWMKFLANSSALRILESLLVDSKVVHLSRVADISLGLVTGSNEFFVLNSREARKFGIKFKWLQPILTKASHLSGSFFTEADFNQIKRDNEKCLLLRIPSDAIISEDIPLQEYLQRGKQLGIADRYKCANRQPWYSVPYASPPTAFLTYMSGARARMTLNRAGISSTNTLHYVRFKCKEENIGAYIAAFYSTLTSLSIELVGRSYGGGVLKLEPSDAKSILLPNLESMPRHVVTSIASYLPYIDEALRNGKDDIWRKIDQVVLQEGMKLSNEDCKLILNEQKNLQMHRLR